VVRWMAAVTMMAALLTGPVAVPDPRPGRPRRGFYPWRAFVGWLRRRGGTGEAAEGEDA
jgi:hypothetical protein